MAYVYQHIRNDTNEIFYIGIGSKDKYRTAHRTYNRNKYWKNITNKTTYKIEILVDNISWEEAGLKEQELIKHHGRLILGTGFLCNITDGGEGSLGYRHSDEVKEYIRKCSTNISNETRRKRSESHLGSKSHRFGKPIHPNLLKANHNKKGTKMHINTREALLKSKKKKVIDIDSGQIFDSISEAASYANTSDSSMTRWVRNINKQYKLL